MTDSDLLGRLLSIEAEIAKLRIAVEDLSDKVALHQRKIDAALKKPMAKKPKKKSK